MATYHLGIDDGDQDMPIVSYTLWLTHHMHASFLNR